MALAALADGFVRLCIDTSLNVLAEGASVVIEGQFYDDGGGNAAAADVLRKVTSTGDIDANYGEGSVLGEALKVAIETCGSTANIFALPRADAAGSVAAAYTVTIGGPATSAGIMDVYVGDARYNISVNIANGTAAADIAIALAAAWNATPGFPFVAVAAGTDVTLTHRNGGTVGNGFNFIYNWTQRNNYAPDGVTFAVAQTVVGAGNPVAPDYDAIFGECCNAAFAILTDDVTWQDGAIAYIASKWACDAPQCFGEGYTYNTGALGAVLATDTNSAEVARMAIGADDPIIGYLQVAHYAASSVCRTLDNPEISVQGPNFGVLDAIRAPEGCTTSWTFAEREQLADAGFVTTVPQTTGAGALTSPQIVNDITNNRFDAEGRENLTFRSVSSRRLARRTAELIAEQLQTFNGLGFFTAGTAIRNGTQGTNANAILGQMRAWAKSQVGVLFSEFDNLNTDLTLTTDFDTAPTCQGRPGVLALNLIYRPPVRVQQITVNAAPRLLDNCA